ncbi:MAG TPA: PIN domain-containing protein [Bacillota bacterium]|nr:PIN domain-containing protein [Bacillota bacterium]
MLEKPVVPVVIDTNVLIPSIYSYTRIARFVYEGLLLLVWNDFTYREASEIIDRLADYYMKKPGFRAEEAKVFLDYMFSVGRKVPDMPEDWPYVTKDRDDDNFLWAAIAGNAEYIITEDGSHMLALKEFRGIPIGTPKDFFRWVKQVHPMSG